MSNNLRLLCGANAVALVLCLSGQGPAFAQNAPEQERPQTDEALAKQHFAAAQRHYDAGRYEDAVSEFLQSYELSKYPELLFNVANAYERIPDYKSAILYLEAYLDTPNPAKKVAVIQRIQRLKAKLKEEELATKEPIPATDSGTPVTNPIVRAPSQSQSTESTTTKNRGLSYALMGTGVVLIGGGAVSGILSNSAENEADDLCAASGICPKGASDAIDREKRYALISDIAIGGGIVAFGVGAILFATGTVEKNEVQVGNYNLNLIPRNDGFQVGVSSVF